MKYSQLFLLIDIVFLAIAFFFPNEIYGLMITLINLVVLACMAAAAMLRHEDKRRHLDEIDLVF